ncbi:MAG: NAD(P)/FAD-dependent oxidoreductase [Hyphomicrobiaceae bacterium]|nr:NAD(P)/FAD-dependent oxidoreductase [Hyphomicrobiaceae bacterium]
MAFDAETVVIGAGVVGLAVARALVDAGHEVMVLERNGRAGLETSTHNSGVVHAGLYYPEGSLKARLTVRGRELLYRFAAAAGVGHQRCGKVIVATSHDEVRALEAIAVKAKAAGVGDLVWLDAAGVRELEPEVSVVAGLHSPSTGIIDAAGLVMALEGRVSAGGGEIVCGAAVVDASVLAGGGFRLVVENAGERIPLTCRSLVVAAGLGATELGARLSGRAGYRTPGLHPARGHYFALARPAPFRHLVYPVPAGGGLGIHASLDLGGRVIFGPDCSWHDTVSYRFDDADGARLRRFEAAIRRYWPGLPDGALVPDQVGVRPRLTPEGAALADFRIDGPEAHGIDGLVGLYGIESPGLTACLAIAEEVAARLGPARR